MADTRPSPLSLPTLAALVTQLTDDEVAKILANRQAARLRHDYKTADRLRDQLNEQYVSVDDKKNRWDASDGRSGAIEPFTCIRPPAGDGGSVTASQAAPAVPPGKKAVPVEEVVVEDVAAAPAAPPSPRADKESKRVLPEKARRELAKQLRAMTGASARLCEKALQSHADDMERAANWLLDQGETKDE